MACFAAWIYVKSAGRDRRGHNRAHVPEKAAFSGYVNACLLAAGAAPQEASLTLQSSAAEWAAAYEHLRGCAVGLGLFKVLHQSGPLAYLNRQTRVVHDYWQATRHCGAGVLFIEFVEAAPLVTAAPVSGTTSLHPTAHLFFEITPFSAARAMQERVKGHPGTAADVLQQWAAQHNNGAGLAADAGLLRLCLAMPTPHSLLVASRHWRTWGFPLVPLRCAKGFGYKFIARLLPRACVSSAGCNSGSGGTQALAQFSPDTLLEIADSMRLLLPASGSSMSQHQQHDLYQRIGCDLVVPPGFVVVATPLNAQPAAFVRRSFLCKGAACQENLAAVAAGLDNEVLRGAVEAVAAENARDGEAGRSSASATGA